MRSENLYLIDEEQMERMDEMISEFQSIYLDIYSNRSISRRSDDPQHIDTLSTCTIFEILSSKTQK